MSNHTVPAAAGGMPDAIANPIAGIMSLLATIPTWMELRIEAHVDARAALQRAARELEALTAASSAIDPESPPAWLLEAEQRHDAASDREAEALAALLAEAARSTADVQARARYLASAGVASRAAALVTLDRPAALAGA